MAERRLLGDPHLGHGVALQAANTEAGEAFDERGGAARLGDHDISRQCRGRLALAVELYEMDRLVEGHALADAQSGAAGHQRGVERDDRVVSPRVDLAETSLEPSRKLLERLAERHDLDAGGLQRRDIRKVCPKIALDHNEPIGRQRRDLAAERAGEIGVAHGDAFGLQQRIDVGQPRAKVGIFPGLDAAMRQAKPAIGGDGLAPQARHEGIARAGKRVRRLLEHVEIGLLGLGSELLDWKLHHGS